MKIHILLLLSGLFVLQSNYCQEKDIKFTQADSIRGTYGNSRNWWDVTHYAITVDMDIPAKKIAGLNLITFKVLNKGKELQIDLQNPMQIDSIVMSIKNGSDSYLPGHINNITVDKTTIRKKGNGYFFNPPIKIKKGQSYYMAVYYHGVPKEAIQPPWDGGFIWEKDTNGKPWVSVACQQLGASVWYPCKDHQADEPDSASLTTTIPSDLVCISNGRLRSFNKENGRSTFTWAVTSPINNYCIVPYIGDYVHFGEVYKGIQGNLNLDYWVLNGAYESAKKQFMEVPRMMKAFEYWFGKFPFYDDGYKLIQSPHLGMEHQSAIAYGNEFKNGYLGRDLSGTGWGLKFDFIIVHESGHEWFANNITSKDIADMWIHESFTNYSETLFIDYHFGKEAGNAYLLGTRANIQNDKPIIGPYNVNSEGSGDMYYKGGNLLHMIRYIINDDEKFRNILIGLNERFYHQTVTTKQIEKYISKKSGINFSNLFDQYLRTTNIPVLEYFYSAKNSELQYRLTNVIPNFSMKLKISAPAETWISADTEWKKIKTNQHIDSLSPELIVDKNFYINTKKLIK